jgi:peptidoglycan/LPS O-acetylase OafA/YrhL
MADFFLSNPIFTEIILPFLLVFVLTFAVLQKSKLLGEGKQQIDAILGFVVAAMFVTFANVTHLITQMTVYFATGLVVLFIFMMLYGFIMGDTKGDPIGERKWLKLILGLAVLVITIGGLLYLSGLWEKFVTNELLMNGIFIAVIVGAVVAVIKGGSSGKS